MARRKKNEYSKNKYIVFTDIARLINTRLNEIPAIYGSLGVEFRVKHNMDCQDINALVANDLICNKWNSMVQIMNDAGFELVNKEKALFDREGIEFSFTDKDSFKSRYGMSVDTFEKVNNFAEFYLPSVRQFLKIYGVEDSVGKTKCIKVLEEQIEAEVIKNIKRFARKKYDSDYYCKNYYHSIRIYNLASKIAEKEGADKYITGLSALLCYAKINNIDYGQLLADNEIPEKQKKEIDGTIIAAVEKTPRKAEAKCLYDALIIDKLGAVGIAGAFAHDAVHNRTMYNVELTPGNIETEQDYQNYNFNTISYFHTELMQLESKVKTKYGKEIAKRRTEFMQEFLYEFYDEWEGII